MQLVLYKIATIPTLYNEHNFNNDMKWGRTDYETCYKTNEQISMSLDHQRRTHINETIKRTIFSMSRIFDEMCSKNKIFFAFLPKSNCSMIIISRKQFAIFKVCLGIEKLMYKLGAVMFV